MALLNPLRYESFSDLSMRLNGTIIRHEKEPVYCECPGNSPYDLTVKLYKLGKKREQIAVVHSSDEALDISSPPLGYMNLKSHTFYVQRAPKRKQNQGLSPSEVILNPETVNTSGFSQDDLFTLGQLAITDTPMYHLIKGEYPKGIEALEQLFRDKSVQSIGFHRRYALCKDDIGIIKLKCITRTIGWVKPNSNVMIIPEQFHNEIFQKELSDAGFDVRG